MRRTQSFFAALFALVFPAAAAPAQKPAPAQQSEWLAVCSRCPSPAVVSKSGIGTANARAEARMTREELKGWCENESPGNVNECLRQQLAEHGNKVYRASADCTAGRITTIEEKTYTLAGLWDNSDIGGGRTKWRDAGGQIVGRDNASNGLAISQQWEVLCPGPPPVGRAAAAPAQAPRAATPARQAAQPPPAPVCGGQPMCTEVNSFAATITDFRTSNVSGAKVVTASVRFQNKLARPIILGYVAGSGVTTDDQGNRYTVYAPDSVRGIGAIASGRVDPKFILRAGEAGDARFEMVWRWSGREIFGLAFEMELAVRELLPLPSGQFRMGPEHPLRFSGLGNAAVSTAPAVPSTPATSAAPVAAVAAVAATPAADSASAGNAAPAADPCAGAARCFSAGPFVAEVQQISSSLSGGRHHVLRFNMRFRNLTAQPLILAATYNSSIAIDNDGNRYGVTPSQAVSGMGVTTGRNADPQFVLAPGESRNAAFQVYRRNSGNPTGLSYTFDVSLEQLEILPSRQIRSVRQFSLNFPDLTISGMRGGAQPAENLNEAGKKLIGIIRGKKK